MTAKRNSFDKVLEYRGLYTKREQLKVLMFMQNVLKTGQVIYKLSLICCKAHRRKRFLVKKWHNE